MPKQVYIYDVDENSPYKFGNQLISESALQLPNERPKANRISTTSIFSGKEITPELENKLDIRATPDLLQLETMGNKSPDVRDSQAPFTFANAGSNLHAVISLLSKMPEKRSEKELNQIIKPFMN